MSNDYVKYHINSQISMKKQGIMVRMRDISKYKQNNLNFQYFVMSNWKLLLNQSNSSHDHSVISTRSKGKYTPRKSKQDNLKSASRFNNLSVSKIQDSILSAEENTVEQRMRMKNYSILQSRLKNCSSQLQLRKPFDTKNKQIIPDQLSDINPANQKDSAQGLGSNMAYQREIIKIKKEFAQFQQIIFKELEKQQKMLNYMVEKILNRIQEGTLESMNKSDVMKSYMKNSSYIREDPLDFLPQYSDISRIKGQFTSRTNKIKDVFQSNASFKTKREIVGDPGLGTRKKSAISFGKFFEAMDNLKQDIKELTEVRSALSPKSMKNRPPQMNWQQVVNRLKTQD